MYICARCGAEYDLVFAVTEFEEEFPQFWHMNFREPVCGKCAIEIINEREENWYFETCSDCGKYFDYIQENELFNDRTDDDLNSLDNDCVFCASCGYKRWKKMAY